MSLLLITTIAIIFLIQASTVSSSSSTTASTSCKDIFAWVPSDSSYEHYYWDSIKTIGFFGQLSKIPGLRDYAHERGVKLVKGVSMDNPADMNNATLRASWIQDQINQAISDGYDGVNIDYEGNNPNYRDGLTALAVETANAFHQQIPNSEVSVDIPIYPEFEGRSYDYVALANACDYLFIMAYDGQFWNNVQCISPQNAVNCSMACSSLMVDEYGVQSYLQLGVPGNKLYFGVPWYGLLYEYIAGIPFFTGQIQYRDILSVMTKHPKGELSFDNSSSTWVFKCNSFCIQDNHATEIWFDDATSLAPKYNLLNKYGLKGVGMWESSFADNTTEQAAMWKAMC